MDLSIELKNSKILIKWESYNADYYKVFFKKDNNYFECAQVYNETFLTLSLAPYGDNECFVQAIKDGEIIAESSKRQFLFDTIDIVSVNTEKNISKIYYSEHKEAKSYRLYKNQDGFNGCKNSSSNCISIEKEDTEYKIKPFKIENEERKFLASSPIFKINDCEFKSVTMYKTYNYNMFLSWNFEGYADGFMVYTENSKSPIFETYDRLCHHLTLTEFKGTTKFYIKAFVNTIYGKLVVAKSKLVSLSIRKFEKPDVSLIIPAYNSKDYIARSIDCALASDFANLEIIIVNDGSTDETQKIIDWYEKNYENVISIQKENGGVADTRNVGIQAAKGEYIAFMDNDDLIRPNMISTLYNSITKNNCDVAISPLYRITDKGVTTHCDLPFLEDVPLDIDKYLEIMYTPGYYNCAIWNKLYRASMVKNHPLGKLRYEDVSWTPCILSYAEKFCYIKTPFYEWDRKIRPETFGDYLAKQPEQDLFEHRKQAMLFFIQNGNSEKREFLKQIAIRRLSRYAKNSTGNDYTDLIGKIDAGKY